MSKDKKILYSVTFSIFAALLITLFVDIGSSRTVTACLLLLFTPITCVLVRKRGSHSIRKRDVFLLMTAIGALYAILTQMSGLYLGYRRNPYYYGSSQVLLKYVLPLAVIIITTEIIRSVLLAQKNKVVDVFSYISFVIAEALMYSNLAGLSSFNKVMDFVGLYLFPAVTANLLYNYISKRYGMFPVIAYRLITVLYTYFLSTVCAMNDALSSTVLILFPLLVVAFVAALFEEGRKKKVQKPINKKLYAVGMTASIVVMISVVMLISCQFRFGAVVIATESMTGEINKGDMIIYERYDDQNIEKGQVIVFMRSGSRIVHRVVDIITVEGKTCYITKGDANEDLDMGYVTQEEIVGLTDFKVAFLGYPTLWLREIISPKK